MNASTTTRRIRRFAAASTLAIGLLGGSAHAAFAAGPQGGNGTFGPAPTTQPQPNPHGPGDVTNHLPGGDPLPCDPKLASCNITSNPGGNTNPGDPQADDDVDDAVVANPTFTG